MQRTANQLRQDAIAIWWAGVKAVQPCNLIPHFVARRANLLTIGEQEYDLASVNRIVIVGAGKASASMAVAVEGVLGEQLLREKHVTGWVNVPGDCLLPTRAVHLHAARPAGSNEPTVAGVRGTQEILRLVSNLGPRDLCIALISGGGSALLPAPRDGFSLEHKLALTREIAARGGSIHQLNAVRRELSLVKGGGLARACRQGQLVSLILSDVLGDDLEVIASGPTVLRQPTPDRAVEVLRELGLADHPAGQAAIQLLTEHQNHNEQKSGDSDRISNVVIANNPTAVDAAGMEAERRGYNHAMSCANEPEGSAEQVAEKLVEMAVTMRQDGKVDCLISGGEPVVTLAEESDRGLGGRNQHLTLAALARLDDWQGIALLSAGTDGEDGPTDAAGAYVDEQIALAMREAQLEPADSLRRSDSYHFFEKVGGLFKTGPTQTNVCDLRIVTVSQ